MNLQAQAGVGVFGDGFGGDAADLVEGLAAQDRAGAAEEGGVPEVVAVLDDAVEELALVGDDAELAEVSLEGIGRIEVVRRLQHAEVGILEEPADGHLQKAARGDVIGIEDGDVGGAEAFEGVVDVAGLGLGVVAAGDVADAGFDGELAELFAVAVVEDVDVEFVGGPVDVEGGERGVADDAERLVVGGDEEVDFGPVLGIVRQGDGGAAQGPDGLQKAEIEDAESVGFRAEEQDG